MNNFLDNQIIREDMEVIFNQGSYSYLKGDKTVLVTGAYGMLASYMVYFMLYLNEVHNYNINIIALSRSIEKFEARFGIYKNKVLQVNKSVNELIDINCDFIIHAASLASPQYYTVQPVDVILPNMLGTYNLLELAHLKKAKLLYFSTCSVYGYLGSKLTKVSESDFGALDPLDAHSCYDESKRMGETLCGAYYRQKGVSAVIARIAHTYGPTMDIENDPRVFASFVKNAINKAPIEIKSDGRARRSFCYITDATSAYFKLLFEGVPGEAYNVCNTNQTVSILELGGIVSKLANVNFIFKQRNNYDTYLQDNNSDNALFVSDKLEKLGFTFKVDISQGFGRVLSFFERGVCE